MHACRTRRLFTTWVLSDASILTARIVGTLCLTTSLLPAAMAASDTPPVMRAAVAVMLAFASCMLLFLASGNVHVLTPLGRAVLFSSAGFMAAVYCTLTLIGFFT